MRDGLAPLDGAVEQKNHLAKLGGLKRDSADARTQNELGAIGETDEVKAPAGAEKLTQFGGELLLALDPLALGGGCKRIDGLASKIALTEAAHDLSKAIEFENGGAGVL
jgi:hypothetical protein